MVKRADGLPRPVSREDCYLDAILDELRALRAEMARGSELVPTVNVSVPSLGPVPETKIDLGLLQEEDPIELREPKAKPKPKKKAKAAPKPKAKTKARAKKKG